MAKRLKIEAGQIFGRLILTGEILVEDGRKFVMAECECGTIKKYRYEHLKLGTVKSCGCIQKMHKRIEIGDVFGRLTVIKLDGVTVECKAKVRCECKTEKWVRIAALNSGHTSSCGCLNREATSKANKTHGLSKHPLYGVWEDIKQRCYNPKSPVFDYYGGRVEGAVKMCDEWLNDFKAFYDWCVANGWENGLELDKDILYNKKYGTKTGLLYSPKFCCFVTEKENCRKRRSTVILEYNGVSKSVVEWGEQFGISGRVISERINRYKWSVEKAITTPHLHTHYKQRQKQIVNYGKSSEREIGSQSGEGGETQAITR